MKPELFHFSLSPTIVPAGKTSRITISGHGDYYRFHDDVTYTVTLCPKEIHDTEIDDDFTLSEYRYNQVKVTPKNGVIAFDYPFIEEQEWELVVSAGSEQKKHLTEITHAYAQYWDLTEMERGITFRLYSLHPDLYQRRVFRGDLHMHSNASDGKENPEMVCANYRRFGYDFCSLTDHHYYPSSLRAKERMEELDTCFTVFPGEEVHNKYAGRFHVVNFNGSSSVNEIILANREQVKAQVKENSLKLEGVSGKEAEEIAWYQWITDQIRNCGGLSIFAHPYWSVKHCYNSPTNITKEVLRRGYFDVYELLGGCTPQENNLQEALYQEMRAEGLRIPVVGSTDVHSTVNQGNSHCACAQTLVFAPSPEEIPNAIMDLYSVAVETLPQETKRAYGPFRLVKYAQFLLDNYYPLHDPLCQASGTLMAEYFKGDSGCKALIEEIEKKIARLEQAFFGRKLS